ncbi:MAG: D-cysteine desulfhydrase family protein [Bacteroidales bacterium]|nr:D-cysteine desulfhydrase family protein [Bacteroidales bacterium]MCL2738566.1 D-cysteine desulfhydrase family protein [Bacteroidales bacterium]
MNTIKPKPQKLSLANLPTRIEYLPVVSKQWGKPIYLKRDDQTGSEYCGNKVRKIEYAVAEALRQGCDTLVTCGGIQSNHCRATAAVAAKLGLKSILLLRIDEQPPVEGNYFLDLLFGADIHFCSREEYRNSRKQIMQAFCDSLAAEGRKGYILPEGASNGIGCFGYMDCMEEIVNQEQELGICFDTIVLAEGSGGTHAGLHLANQLMGLNKRVVSFCVCDDRPYFVQVVTDICTSCLSYMQTSHPLKPEDIEVIDRYVGRGYGLSTAEELAFIAQTAKENGLLFDPVYTGKAFYGLMQEVAAGTFHTSENILFIHTGGIFGLFSKKEQFIFV